MGLQATCCNPASAQGLAEIEALVPNADHLQIDPMTCLQSPSQAMIATLAKAEQYRKHAEQINSGTGQEKDMWVIDTKRAEKDKRFIFVRGGEKNVRLHGEVMLIFPTGQIFKGQMTDNVIIEGSMVFRQDCFYVGQVKDLHAEGTGHFENGDSGYRYDGEWSKSLPHGKGKETYSNGDHYEGQIMFGAKFGTGTYTFANRDRYEGSFYFNQSDGRGRMQYSSGDRYEGDWKLGAYDGKGKFNWSNGEVYEGDYVEGRREGEGKYLFQNKSWFEGQWRNGVQHGEGIFHEGFDEIKGTWQEGELLS